jgi:serine/threonine-protein kinase
LDPSHYSGADDAARSGLATLFDPAAPALSADVRRASLAAALRWALVTTQAQVLVVDDIDFIDGTSFHAFASLLSEPASRPMLVVVTYTPSRASAGEPAPEDRVLLEPLPRPSIAQFLPSGVAEKGAPLTALHFEQLVAWSQETREQPPEHLAELVARRIERLTPAARSVLSALVVWGDDARPDILSAMLPADTNVLGGLESLRNAGMVTLTSRGIRTSHALVRRVAFASIPVGKRAELFEQAAELRTDAPLEIRARQALYTGNAFETLALLDAVGSQRAAAGDMAGSVSTLRRALDYARRELYRAELDDPVGAMLTFARKLAEALAAMEKWPDAEGVLREALGNAPPRSEHRARLLGVLARVASARQQPDKARVYLDEAMNVAQQCGASGLLPKLEELARTVARVA